MSDLETGALILQALSSDEPLSYDDLRQKITIRTNRTIRNKMLDLIDEGLVQRVSGSYKTPKFVKVNASA